MFEKKLRILVAEGNAGELAPTLRALYPEAQDGLELTVVSGVSTLILYPRWFSHPRRTRHGNGEKQRARSSCSA